MVPVVVYQVLFTQHFVVQCHLVALHTLLVNVALIALYGQLAVLESQAQAVGQVNERSIAVTVLLVGTEPQLQSVVVGGLRCEGRDVNVERLLSSQFGGAVVVVDIPAFCGHRHVARVGLVDHGRAVALVHVPVAHQSGHVGRFRLLAVQIELLNVPGVVPQRQVAHASLHLRSAHYQPASQVDVVGGHFFQDVYRTVVVSVSIDGAQCTLVFCGVVLVAQSQVYPLVERQLHVR